jgi:hypothetical protein
VFANVQAGVTNWTQYLKLVTDPIYPNKASAYGESFMLSVDDLIANIFINSYNP